MSPAGAATGVAAGTAVVSASRDGKQASARITVLGGGPASLEVRPGALRIAVDERSQLAVVARDASGRSVGPGGVRWASSDPTVAVVSTAGVVTGRVPGSATITATSGGVVSAPATLTVTAPGATGRAVLQVFVLPWANLAVDGASHGQLTREIDTLTAGVAHRLHFERNGFVSVDSIVTLRPGEQRLLRVQMTARQP